MPKMLAQANRKLLWVPANGILNVNAPKVTSELGAGGVLDLSCLVTKNNYSLGPTGDDSIDDPALCAQGNSTVPGNTTYEAVMDFFRWTTSGEDVAWSTFTQKGISGFLVERIGKPYTSPIVATDPLRVFGAITGTPMDLNPEGNGGFEKFRETFYVQSEQASIRAVAAAG
jgi:hypothetical protein